MAKEVPSYGSYVILEEDRFRSLSETEKNVTKLVTAGNSQLRALREEVASLRKVLEWYADRSNWRPRGTTDRTRTDDDRGKKARRALGLPT